MALFRKTPLVYFHGIVPGKYLAVWPVFIVGDDPDKLTFKVAVDNLSYAGTDWQAGLERGNLSESASEGCMAYLTTAVRQRLHQRGFRETSPSS
jgi:putative restriction endonuclease